MKFISKLRELNIIWLFLLLLVEAVAFGYGEMAIRRSDGAMDPYHKLFFAFAVLGIVLMVGVFFVGRKIRLPELFLILSLTLGVMYTTLVPVTCVPDESHAISVAYVVASRITFAIDPDIDHSELALDYGDEVALLRHDEADNPLKEVGVDRAYYDEYLPKMNDRISDATPVGVGYELSHSVPKILFLPSAIGITIGRFLGLGVIATLLLGRLVNLLCYTLMGYAVLRMIPIMKEVLFVVMLLPMCMQQAASFSYDAMVLAMSFLFFGLVMKLCDCAEPQEVGALAGTNFSARIRGLWKDKMFWQKLLLIVLAILLSMCKYGALFPLVLLSLLIYFTHRKTNKGLAYTGLLAPVAGFLFGFLPKMYELTHTAVLARETVNYTVGDLLSDPVHTFILFGNTIYQKADYYFYTMLGSSLGNLELNVPAFVILIFFGILVWTVWKEQGTGSLRTKLFMALIFLMGAGMAIVGMGIAETPNTMEVIQAVQGRYFLPFLMCALYSFKGKKVEVEEDGTTSSRSYLPEAMLLAHYLVMVCLFLRAL